MPLPSRAHSAATVASLLVGMLVASLLVFPAPAALGAECRPAGGANDAVAPDWRQVPADAAVAVAGGGFGHGVGMSQYGARGAALLGCSYQTILGTYYPGTRISAQPMPNTVRVGLHDMTTAPASLVAEGGAIRWECTGLCIGFPTDEQAVGTKRVVSSLPNGTFVLDYTSANGAPQRWTGGDQSTAIRAYHEPAVAFFPEINRRSRWGHTVFDSQSGSSWGLTVFESIGSGGGATGMERYLWGLDEMPSSWPAESLKAQAVAARSYALLRISGSRGACRCFDLYANTRDQNWVGWGHERDAPAWVAAVNATPKLVLRYGSRTADAFYSATTGGWSESARDVWGSADIPYLQAVDTSRWERAGSDPYRRWTAAFSQSDLATRFGLVTFHSLTVVHRGQGGRPTAMDGTDAGTDPDGVRVEGADATGAPVTRWFSGEGLRWALGVRSARVWVYPAPPR
ncbi:MAG: SpoIID/LytB domain-containing protein [Nitriliruptorales bacterium]